MRDAPPVVAFRRDEETAWRPSSGVRLRRRTEFRPYVPAETILPEFTLRAVLVGIFAGLFFGAVTVYVGLRAGLTVSASIPISVLSISILRIFGKVSILENNIVQTVGSAGESIAGGVIFTLPALIFLGFPLEYWSVFFLALIGGWLGVLFMIPLRRQLIVKEHGNLLYPEGTACADVLVAGDRGGSFASRVFWGLGLGGTYISFNEYHGRVARHAYIRSRVASGRIVSRQHHAGISGRRLHHRAAHRGNHRFRRRFFLAGDDARDPLFRFAGSGSGAVSQHHPDSADDFRPDLVELHPPHGRGRGGGGGRDHAGENPAHDLVGADRGS